MKWSRPYSYSPRAHTGLITMTITMTITITIMIITATFQTENRTQRKDGHPTTC